MMAVIICRFLKRCLIIALVLIGLDVCYSQSQMPEIDGYHFHRYGRCPGYKILGDLVVLDVHVCKSICDSFAQCEGFEFRGYTGATNCWPKGNCSQTDVNDFWDLYVRNPGGEGCTFDEVPGHALNGSNDVDLAHATPVACKRKCLLDTKCLSFILNVNTAVCSLSYKSRYTETSLFGKHQGMTYYHKMCGPEVDDVPDEIINAPDLPRIVIKGGQCTKVAGPIGQPVGHIDFSDEDFAKDDITGIKASFIFGTYLERLGLKYGKRRFVMHGNKRRRQEVVKVKLQPDEYITRIEGNYNIRLEKITFITNHRSIPIGAHVTSYTKTFTADGAGKPLLYISGSADYGVAHINFHFQC